MKKGLLFVLLLVCFIGFGQCNFRFTEQSHIDNFASDYPNCTAIDGLEIIGNNITNLHGLSQITSANVLIIAYTEIQNFEGLENLESISETFMVTENNSLENFIGFSSLSSLRSVTFSSNNNLSSFHGLENLVIVEGHFDIKQNELLSSLNGLQGLTSSFSFSIADSAIINFEGLSNLTTCGRFSLGNNPHLINLYGLESLATLDELVIFENANLVSLDGIEILNQVESGVEIYHNENLSSIDALSQIVPTNYVMALNSNLTECAINSVCQSIYQYPDYYVYIDVNGPGCNSVPEVEAQCQLTITETDFSEKLSLFPNPVSSILNIEIPTPISFQNARIYSTLGQLILETSEKTINLETLSAGIYLLEVATDRGSVTKKIVKQ